MPSADDKCEIHQYTLSSYAAQHDATIKSSFVLYASGSVALLVNIAVFVLIIGKKSLRDDLTVRLVLSLSVCDTLIGLATALYASFQYPKMCTGVLLDQLQGNYRFVAFYSNYEKVVNTLGPIMTCSVFSSVFGSVLAMLEKLFKIVYGMKPNVRLGRKTVVLSLLLSWSLSATFAILSVYGIWRNEVHSTTHG